MRLPVLFIIHLILLLLPWLALWVLGGIWLWQNQYLPMAVPIVLSFYGVAWILGRKLKKAETLPSVLPTVNPDDRWSPEAKAIWRKIDSLANELDPADYPLTDASRLSVLAHRVITEVAAHFHPGSSQAELDVPLRNILYIVEQVCRDLRELLDERVPFSHLISVHDGLQLLKWTERLRQANTVRRALTMVISPFIAIPRELKLFFSGKLGSYTKGLLERWLLQTIVKQIGYYAIALYSGHMAPPASIELDAEPEETNLVKRPLRVLVTGQTNAGKSSLINGLVGEFKTTVDALPVGDAFRIYQLHHPDMEDVLFYDSPGYGDGHFWFKDRDSQLGDFDLVIVVCSALQAGREADSRFLSEMDNWFNAHLERSAPSVIAVVTHIDQLRPVRQWSPPYDMEHPGDDKARNIREAVATVAQSLHVAIEDCVPVCLSKPAEYYNIESVLASMVKKLPDSLRAQYLRTLVEGQRKEKIMLLLGQLGMRRN